jgi:hypothetical protein
MKVRWLSLSMISKVISRTRAARAIVLGKAGESGRIENQSEEGVDGGLMSSKGMCRK